MHHVTPSACLSSFVPHAHPGTAPPGEVISRTRCCRAGKPRADWCEGAGTAETRHLPLQWQGRGPHPPHGRREGLSRAGLRWMQTGPFTVGCPMHLTSQAGRPGWRELPRGWPQHSRRGPEALPIKPTAACPSSVGCRASDARWAGASCATSSPEGRCEWGGTSQPRGLRGATKPGLGEPGSSHPLLPALPPARTTQRAS